MGKERVSGTLATLSALLSTSWIAALLGLLLGGALVAPLLIGTRLVASGNTDAGLYAAMGGVFGGLLVALGALFGFRAIAPDAFLWFGCGLIVGFLVFAGGGIAVAGRRLWSPDESRR
jgi:hypothetical protein